MKTIYRWSGYFMALIASIFFMLYVFENWKQLPADIFEGRLIIALIVAPFIYIIGFLLTGIAWHILLTALGEKSQLLKALTILLISQFAKYLPGNFGHHVGRVVMARNAGFSGSLAIFSMTLEAGGAILAGLGVGVLALVVDDSAFQTGSIIDPSPTKLILLGLTITALPLVAITLAKRFTFGRLRKSLGIDTMQFPKFRSLLSCYFLYVGNFLILGSILYFLLSSLTNADGGHFLYLTGLIAISWLVGFITPGAPGGLGVREALLVAALDPLFGAGIALSLAFGMRVITTIGDAIGFLAGLGLRQWAK